MINRDLIDIWNFTQTKSVINTIIFSVKYVV
jgi:hypothetical protein